MPDIGTALTNSIAKDGQTTPTANLPMGGNRHTGVSDGVLGTQYSSINQAQNGSLIKVGSVANATDAFTGSIAPAIAGYTDGLIVTMTPTVTTTTVSPTLALNGLTVKPIQKEGGVACAIGDLVLNVPVHLQYTTQASGYWMLLNPQVITSARLTAIADSKLSSNVPLKNTANTFTATMTLTPGSGGALAATSVSASYVASLVAQNVAGSSNGLNIQAGTNASDVAINVVNAAITKNLFLMRGDGSWFFDNTVGGQFGSAGPVSVAGTWTFSSGPVVKGDSILTAFQNTAGTNALRVGTVKAWTGAGSVTDAAIGANGNMFFYATGASTPAIAATSTNVQIADETTTLQDAGFRGLPQNAQGGGTYTTVMSDRGKHIYNQSAGTVTHTIAANASVPYPLGTTITFCNIQTATSYSIAINSDTLVFSANNTTGTRTLAAGGMATAVKVEATKWFISGAGLS